MRALSAAVATVFLLSSCDASQALDQPSLDDNASEEVAQEPLAEDFDTPSTVYDPDLITKRIRETPESSEWDAVWAYIESINYHASLGPGLPIQAQFSPTVNIEMAEATVATYQQAMGLWSFFGVEKVPVVWSIMSEEDFDWWYERVLEIEGANPALDVWNPDSNVFGHCSVSERAFCGYGNPQQSSGIMFQYNMIGSAYEGTPSKAVATHEAVHFYQSSLSQTSYSFMPCWFIEGQATFIENAVVGDTKAGVFAYGLSDLARFDRGMPGDETWAIEQWVELLDNFLYVEAERQRCIDGGINYTLGGALFEHLYGTYSMWTIHEWLMSAAQSEDFEAATQEVLEVSVDELHLELATYMHRILQPDAS